MPLKVLVATTQAQANDSSNSFASGVGKTTVDVETVADRVIARFDGSEGMPDLLLLDFSFPGLEGINGIRTMLDVIGDRPLGVLVDYAQSVDIENAYAAGAAGVLHNGLSPEAFQAALVLLHSGLSFAILDQKQVCDRLKEVSTLSAREVQVLSGICNGLQNKEIAHAFDIQEVTVKMHVRAIIRKLGARNRTHAAMLARDFGIV